MRLIERNFSDEVARRQTRPYLTSAPPFQALPVLFWIQSSACEDESN